jgi:acetyl/propionyl-CoA carboxylase alpha subunit
VRRNFKRILIANRGEIAVRIIRTCRSLGIEPIAVYSDFDRDALHVRMGANAVRIGPAEARVSYLNGAAIITAAKKTHADAIHPGYGFLSENADFASACEQAGIAFIGPSPEVIRALGSKLNARQIAEKAGVPVVPTAMAGAFPVLIKAAAGGGGRGMRIVRSQAELEPALEAARGEAERAFNDGALLLERYIEDARHIEIQILGDQHGNLIHLFERDCTVQRRYQKIIEESPAPGIEPELRDRMAEAALTLARRVGYTNAGTVEFLLAPSGEFYFIEVNTRIQVEHPVTELVTGVDLIQFQIEVSEGKPLDAATSPQRGHAIEARLYAEDPLNDFLPSTGTVRVWQPPENIRVDTAVERGTAVGVHYDSLLAKVIAHAPDRESAVRKLVYALRSFAAQGLATNREYLIDVLETGDLRPKAHANDDELLAGVVRAHIEESAGANRRILPSVPVNYRNNPYPRPAMNFEIGGREYAASASAHSDVDGRNFQIENYGDEYYIRSPRVQRTVRRLSRFPRPSSSHQHESANSPMPGQVLRIIVAAGQRVEPGDALVVLEAMKMEQTIRTAIRGVVQAILVKPGAIVAPGQQLVDIEATEDSDERTSSSAAGRD